MVFVGKKVFVSYLPFFFFCKAVDKTIQDAILLVIDEGHILSLGSTKEDVVNAWMNCYPALNASVIPHLSEPTMRRNVKYNFFLHGYKYVNLCAKNGFPLI